MFPLRAVFIVNLIVIVNLIFITLYISRQSSEVNDGREVQDNTSSSKRPNFVVFLVDDLGIGDVGCYGNNTIKTPNIDRLATMGAKLNHNLSPESICTPSRAAMLTGRYAIRSGMASGPDAFRAMSNLASPGGLPSNETTFGEILQQSGYRTSMIGKWHLGLNCNNSKDACHHPMNMGFDEFYGLPLTNLRDCGPREEGSVLVFELQTTFLSLILGCVCLGFALAYTAVLSKRSSFIFVIIIAFCIIAGPLILHSMAKKYVCVLMRGFDVVEQPTILQNLTVKFTKEAKHFIKSQKEKPFLLFMSYVKVHAVLFSSPEFAGHSAHGRYGDNVEEMDWSVGEIVSTLEKEDLLEDTFVYFTSDQGPYLELILPSGEHLGGWAEPFRGGKGQSWEGGIRVPTVAVWKDHIPQRIEINEPTNTMDIFTTMVELAGASVPTDRVIDGKNIFPLLTQEQSKSPHEFMFHYCGTSIHAVRYRPRSGDVTWKAHFITPKWSPGVEACNHLSTTCQCFGKDVKIEDPPLLYDIASDPYERQQLDTSTTEHQDIINRMKEAIVTHQLGVNQVPNQLGYPNAWWTPRLQPCCNFPFCSCVEPSGANNLRFKH